MGQYTFAATCGLRVAANQPISTPLTGLLPRRDRARFMRCRPPPLGRTAAAA